MHVPNDRLVDKEMKQSNMQDDTHADENELADPQDLPHDTPYDMCLMTCLEKYDDACKN